MRVLVSGAAGFVGSHVVRKLLADGHEVNAIVRDAERLGAIADIAGEVRIVPLDLRDRRALGRRIEETRPDVCVHSAWSVPPNLYPDAPQNAESLQVSVGFAEALADAGCPAFVGIGTCWEYETSTEALTEDSPTRPSTPYGAAKLELWRRVQRLAAPSRMRAAWLRLFSFYGPFEHQDRLVPSVVRSLLANRRVPTTSGEQIRDYLYVEDVAEAVAAIARRGSAGVFNVGSGVPIAVRDLIARIETALDRGGLVDFGALPQRSGEPRVVYADSGKLAREVGWAPRHDLEEGIARTIEWWRAR